MKGRLWATAWIGIFGLGWECPAQDFEPVNYGRSRMPVDLAVGLWAFPLPMDYDGDGDHDLLVACPDKPANGVYFFENTEGDVKFPVFRPGRRLGPARHFMQPSVVEGKVEVMASGLRFVDFRENGFTRTEPVYPDANIHPHRVRQNTWRYVDYDGDGAMDLTVGVGDWTEYGWDAAYDARGEWRNGPLHGLVYWIPNRGTTEQPDYAEPRPVLTNGVPLDVYGWPSPNFADFDGDGDLDLVCGEFLDRFTYFENTGTREAPVYRFGERLRDQGQPLEMDLQMIVPVALDWDKDGDVDLVVGDEDGRVALVEHTGRVVQGLPQFRPPVYFRQEPEELNAGALATPVAFDWDADGDEDLLVGNTAGYVLYFENLDGGAPPRWAAPRRLRAGGKTLRIQAGPKGSIQGPCEAKWGYTTLSVADWDHDGLPDIVLNSIWGEVLWCRNEGTRSSPRLAAARPVEVAWEGAPPKPRWCWWTPRGKQLVTQWRTTPVAVDWNRDGLTDLVMLDHEGYLCLFERARREGGLVLLPPQRVFVDEHLEPIRLAQRSAGGSGRFKLCVTDWDGDGHLDLLVNSENAAWYRQVDRRDGNVVLQKLGNLGKQNLAGHTSSPTVCDWNGDGKPELLVGTESGMIYHLSRERAQRLGPGSEMRPRNRQATESGMGKGFVFESAPFPQCHASTLEETPRGLVAAWFGGTHEKHEDVCIWSSYHDGAGWKAPVRVASGEQHDGSRFPCWNPVLYQEPNGPLRLFYKCGPDPRRWWGMQLLSYDGGRTWRNSQRLPEGILGPIKNKPLRLSDGGLLCPSSTEDEGWRVHVERWSGVEGRWRRSGPVADPQGLSAIQPAFLDLGEGQLQMLCRSRSGMVATSYSFDEGETWTPLERTTLPSPSSGVDALTLKDGRHVIVYNPRESGRSRLQLALSRDGKRWHESLVLEDEPGEEFSYPAVIQLDDGAVHVSYTWKRQRIAHVRLDPQLFPSELQE